MKTTSLSERQVSVLMNVGRSIAEAIPEFRGRTPADIATAAYQAYSAAVALQLPAVSRLPAQEPANRSRRKRRKAVKKVASKPEAKPLLTPEAASKRAKIVKILKGSNGHMPASAIAEKTGISGQGLGPVLNKMCGEGLISRKKVDGENLWGSKPSKSLNGKAHQPPAPN